MDRPERAARLAITHRWRSVLFHPAANADGLGSLQPNDVVYVPESAVPGGDIMLVQPDAQGRLGAAPAYDTSRGRGIYQLRLPARNEIQDLESRWQAEISARYVF